MRRVAGILVVLVAATLGGLWIGRPLRPAALEARAVAVTVAATTTTVDPDAPASTAPLTGPFQVAKAVPGSVEVFTAPDGP